MRASADRLGPFFFCESQEELMRSAEARGSGEVERVVSFDAALETVLAQAGRLHAMAVEQVRLSEVLGRVLAEAVAADHDHPPFDRSTRDGFAVRAAGAGDGEWLRVAGQVRAGEEWSAGMIESGTAIEVMTGA